MELKTDRPKNDVQRKSETDATNQDSQWLRTARDLGYIVTLDLNPTGSSR